MLFRSRYLPCPTCGASVERSEAVTHECDPARRVDYEMFGHRAGVTAFAAHFREHLESPIGRFHTWLAARQVRGGKD